jgi:hypothetical protein
MPRKKGSVNKSAVVRELLGQNPKAPVRDIVASMDNKGLKISPNLVYLIKAKLRSGKAKQSRQKATHAAAGNGRGGNTIELVRKVKDLASQVGGYSKLKELAEILAD